MRITVDIPEDILKDLSIILNDDKKSPAVAKAVTEFVRREKASDFARMLRRGEFDYPTTNEGVEQLQD
jgi:hypothetical protein